MQAQYHLAWCYDTKNATPVQQAEAAYWYLQSARKGHYQSTCTIGEFYLQGIAVPQSDQEAVYWLKKSALKGNSRAAYLLGECYLAGRGVKKDMQEAIHWLKQGSDIYRGGKTTATINGDQASPIQRISRGDREVTLKTFMRGYQVFTDWVVPPLILLLCLGAFLTIMKK